MSYTVEYSWIGRETDEDHEGTMGPFSTEEEANIMLDTVCAMLEPIADHWGAYVQKVVA